MRNKITFSLIVPVLFLAVHFWLKYLPGPVLARRSLPLLIAFLAIGYLHRRLAAVPAAWGIHADIGVAARMAFICCLPMLLGYGFMAGFQPALSWEGFWLGCVFAALGEELFYRGFLFGQLFRFGGWGFLPAGLLNALVFASGHLYQADDWAGALGIFAVTAAGGMWFAWLYIEWDNNLWVPVFLHFLMNLWWTAFEVSETAGGGWMANLFRAATIAATVVWTLRRKRRAGGLTIRRANLIYH